MAASIWAAVIVSLMDTMECNKKKGKRQRDNEEKLLKFLQDNGEPKPTTDKDKNRSGR